MSSTIALDLLKFDLDLDLASIKSSLDLILLF
jgi:hypothetical protein